MVFDAGQRDRQCLPRGSLILFGNRLLDHLRAAQGVIRLSDQYGDRRLVSCRRNTFRDAPDLVQN